MGLRIITVNLPVSYIKAIASLTGNKSLYPSRSELIRVAVREFLLREIEAAKSFEKYQEPFTHEVPTQKPEKDDQLFVQVPMGSETKIYKLVDKKSRGREEAS